MFPVMAAIAVAGSALSTLGKLDANAAQAEAERANAGWYREQADFARETGERKRTIFDRQTLEAQGQQASAFAKAGVSSSNSSLVIAQQLFYRQGESLAIKKESDMNVRLAMMRADQAQKTANDLSSSYTQNMTILSGAFSAIGAGAGAMGGGSMGGATSGGGSVI